jgi:hypothetical protein
MVDKAPPRGDTDPTAAHGRSVGHSASAVGKLWVGLAVAMGCPARSDPGDDLPYRIVDPFFNLITCSGDGNVALAISSPAQLEELVAQLSAQCTGDPDPQPLLDTVERDLARAGVDLDRNSLLLIQQVYGSGMITARLELAMTAPRRLTATVVAVIPEGPLTPDLAIRRFAVVIDRSAIDEVEVVTDGRRRALLPLAGGAAG